MKKTLLSNPDVALIAEEFLSFYGRETGLFSEQDIEKQNLRFYEFVTFKIGEEKAKSKKEGNNLEELAKQMQDVVPNIKVQPSNKSLRSNTQNLVNKLKTFVKSWKYDNTTILEATKMYGQEVEMNPTRMFSPLNYFILKERDSKLAEYCDKVLDGAKAPETTYQSYSKII